jgi:hypothetical protein
MNSLMTQEEHLLCEIEEFKLELQQSKDRIARLERFIKEKETELYYHRTKSRENSLFQRLQDIGFSSVDTCNNICEIVMEWLPDKIESDDEFCSGWNDFRDTLLDKIK